MPNSAFSLATLQGNILLQYLHHAKHKRAFTSVFPCVCTNPIIVLLWTESRHIMNLTKWHLMTTRGGLNIPISWTFQVLRVNSKISVSCFWVIFRMEWCIIQLVSMKVWTIKFKGIIPPLIEVLGCYHISQSWKSGKKAFCNKLSNSPNMATISLLWSSINNIINW